MKKEELTQEIGKKGAVAKTLFYSFYKILDDVYGSGSCLIDKFDEDTLAIMSYNTSIFMMEKIRDYPDFFERRCKVKERNRKRMLKDLETMTLQEHHYEFIDVDYEKEVVDNLINRFLPNN